MSDALDYLIKMRPDAILPYFQFLKEAGKHLDIKTRDLISVITKVDAQTEAGFRQYLKRALRDGCSADEVLDALLMAFPTLGLTKIIWAINQILAMELPEFQKLAPAAWHVVTALEKLPDGKLTSVETERGPLFIYKEGATIRVFDGRCPHQGNEITPLSVSENNRVTCPKHHWVFDGTTGKCLAEGDRPLIELEHKIEDGELSVRW